MFNKIKQVAKQGFELGRSVVKRAPGAIGQILDYGNKAAAIAKQIGDTASRVKAVYGKSSQVIKPSTAVDSGIQKTFNTVSTGVKRINEANSALQQVGGNVLTLF